MSGNTYDLIVVGSGFAGSATALAFLETCKAQSKPGRVLIVESGKDGERCGASRWTSAYLRLDKDNNLDPAWVNEMDRVSQGLHDKNYCAKMYVEVPKTMAYLLEHGVTINHHR
jgi:tricarballylate dehydrogenase